MLNHKQILQLTLISLLLYLPFLGKGLSNDDLVFLDYAKRLTKNPAVCSVTDYLFLGVELKDMVVFESTHPPLVPYVLRVAMQLFGERLWVLHLVMYGFLWLACVSVAGLIARHTRAHPLLALALTLGPLFLPNATSLMTDMALFALWFTAIYAWDRALDENGLRSRWHWLTAMATVGAIFTAYQGLGLLFILPFMAQLRRRLWDGLIWAAACAAPFALWVLMVWINYQILPYFAPPRAEISIANEVHKGLAWANISLKARAIVFHFGGALLFLAPVLAWRKGRMLFLAAAGWGLALSAYLFPEEGFWFTAYASLLAATGLLGLIALAESAWVALTRHDDARATRWSLLASAVGLLLFQIFITSFAAPRYSLIPIGAALVLALSCRTEPLPGIANLIGLVPTLCLGLAVGRAEFQFAESQRIDRLDLPKGEIYFAGEKGIHYSGERAGYRYFLPRLSQEVHLLLVPEENDHVAVPSELIENAELVKTLPLAANHPLRVMNRDAGAAFYISNHGILPFGFSNTPVDTYRLYRLFHPGFPSWLARKYVSAPAGEILPETPISQDFTCGPDGLTSFRLMLATYNRQNDSTLVVQLEELNDATGQTVFLERVPARSLADNQWRNFAFKPLASKGKRYRLTLSSPDASPATAVTLWTNTNAVGTYRRGLETKTGALGFESLCAPGGKH